MLVAANRDEFLARPTGGPQLLDDPPRLVAGVDLVAGGTWLGVNQDGVVAAVLNRRTVNPPNPNRRSRGALCAEALRLASIDEAKRRVLRWPPLEFNPCTLFLARVGGPALVLMNEETGWKEVSLGPGLHVLTNRPLGDVECPRRARAFARFSSIVPQLARGWSVELLGRLREMLADHAPQENDGVAGKEPICVHLPGYGTRTATVIAVLAQPGFPPHANLWATTGPPCTTPFGEPLTLALAARSLDSVRPAE